MAEKPCVREGLTRRSSFRKSLQDGSLPAEYLESLEQKRKQLDDSIHKYIASKEREYKQFEHDLRQQTKGSGGQGSQDVQQANGVGKRRTSSESTQDAPYTTPQLARMNPVDALLSAGLRRDFDSSQAIALDDDSRPASAGTTDRGAVVEREKDFVGVFTPDFLPALDNKETRPSPRERTSSAPAIVESPQDEKDVVPDLPRAHSDTAVQAKTKRPAHLEQLAQRTSSSGSSADGKLASAMKSPTHLPNARPKRKRVSLAVGDSIVAPSDSVPVSLSMHTTPSHSRTRSPGPERERTPLIEEMSLPEIDESAETATATAQRVEDVMNGNPGTPATALRTEADVATTQPTGNPVVRQAPAAAKIDPDGDLFDLEESDSPAHLESTEESEDGESGVVGRIARAQREEQAVDLDPDEHYEYDPEAGLIQEADSGVEDVNDVESHAGSATASQHPMNPGFRRPSVSSDPVFRGSDYNAVEQKAVEEEVYGSSYSPPPTKGSFTGGSLGESYMARHAQEMERLRIPRNEGQVRS